MPESPWGRLLNPRIGLAALAIVFLAGAAATALTERPWCDEAWFAEPAWNLVRIGEMSTPTLDNSLTPALESLNKYTYWVFPTYLVSLGAWSWVFGFSLFAARAYSIFWGGVLLASAATLLRKLGVGWNRVLLALAMLAVDYQFLRRASEVRMDIMCAALGLAAIAFYMARREENHLQAMVGSHVLCAAGAFTHPMGLLAYVSLLFTQIYFDRPKFTLGRLCLAALPYLVGMAIWSLYILQSPDDFAAQLGQNAAGRGGFWSDPFGSVLHEFYVRYVVQLGGIEAGVEWFKALKAVGLATIVAGLLGLLFCGRAPGEPAGLVRYLGAVTAIHATGLLILDGTKMHFYLIHILPWLYMLTALAAGRIWHGGGWRKPAVALWLLGYFVVQSAGSAYPIYRNSMSDYLAAVELVEKHTGPDRLVMGSAELGFKIGYADDLLDDWTLGCLNGLQPDIIVQESGYRQRQTQWRTECDGFVQQRLAPSGDYRLAMEKGEYSVYLRRGLDSEPAAASR